MGTVLVESTACRLAAPSSVQVGDFLDAISSVPLDRWDSDGAADAVVGGRFGGFVAEWAGFDAAAFGISPSEAAFMDPAQRVLLEVYPAPPPPPHTPINCFHLYPLRMFCKFLTGAQGWGVWGRGREGEEGDSFAANRLGGSTTPRCLHVNSFAASWYDV
jgi:hypothetical protein